MNVEQVTKAAKALTALASKKDNELIEKERFIFLTVTTKQILARPPVKPIRLGLKHRIVPENPEICLITKDPQREYKDLVAEKELKAISKVVGVSKLKAKFKPYEAKRQLCASFDLFLTDDRVMAVLPRLLGKSFFEKKKLPIPITLKKDTISSELDSVLNSTVVYFTRGTCHTAKVALESHSAEQMVDNILLAAEAIVKKIPGKWDNVQCIHVKTASSIALPIFNSLPTAKEEKVQEKQPEAPVSLKKKRKTEKKAEEEEKTMADLVQGKEPKKLKTKRK